MIEYHYVLRDQLHIIYNLFAFQSTIENLKPFPNIWSVKLLQALKHTTGKLISIESN